MRVGPHPGADVLLEKGEGHLDTETHSQEKTVM